jgi:hypothetical protein
LLLNHLWAGGVRARHVWLRFPFFFSLPLLVYARWRGLSWYERHGQVQHGYWDFRPSHLLRRLLPWTLLVDAGLAGLFNIYLPLWLGQTVVCERFVLDMLADLSVAFDVQDLHRRAPGSWYTRLLPSGAAVFILDLEQATVQARRPDLLTDKRLAQRLEIYRVLCQDLGLVSLSSMLPVEMVQDAILEQMKSGAP